MIRIIRKVVPYGKHHSLHASGRTKVASRVYSLLSAICLAIFAMKDRVPRHFSYKYKLKQVSNKK